MHLAGAAVRDAGRSPDAGFPWPPDAQEVGRIVDAWGIKGWVKVEPYSKEPQALVCASHWYLRDDEAAAGPRSVMRPYPSSIAIAQVRAHGEFLVAKPRASADRTSAEALRGARIFISRTDFPATDVDEFYWVDLIGLQVVNRDGHVLGTVSGLIDTGAQSVLQVRAAASEEAAAERLIPFVSAYVDRVDLQARRIEVDWGLDF